MDYKPSFALATKSYTAWKVSVFGVFLVFIFPHSNWIRRDTEYLSPYSVRVPENTDQKNSVFGLLFEFLREVSLTRFDYWTIHYFILF